MLDAFQRRRMHELLCHCHPNKDLVPKTGFQFPTKTSFQLVLKKRFSSQKGFSSGKMGAPGAAFAFAFVIRCVWLRLGLRPNWVCATVAAFALRLPETVELRLRRDCVAFAAALGVRFRFAFALVCS